MADQPLSAGRTAAAILVLALIVGLAGDACHVAAGTTRYEWEEIPTLWKSAIWFPVALSLSVLGAAWLSERAGTAAVKHRTRADAVAGAAVVLALYAVTALLNDVPATVSVVLVGAIAVAVWAWWDPSPGALTVAVAAAVLGPLAEIAVVAAGASSYGDSVDGLAGVAPWLPCLYFAAGAVAARLWAAIARRGLAQPACPRPPGTPSRTGPGPRVPRFHSSQNASSAASNSSSRPSFSAFARAAIVGP